LNRLVGEAAETAQLSVGVKLDLKPHAIEEIIDAATKDCQTLLGRRSVSVQLRSGLRPVRADLNRIQKALVQLLENAIKYSPREEAIVITAELNGHFVITSMADRGGGIHESELGLIFEKFYRGEDHRYAVQGTGMGLPIANAIIRAHGGSLTVTSQLGTAAFFAFSLPIYYRCLSR
jgi:two-component system sensor histidine kinase KdpD